MSTNRSLRGVRVDGISKKVPKLLHLPSLRDSWCQPTRPSVLFCGTEVQVSTGKLVPTALHVQAALYFFPEFSQQDWTDFVCALAGVETEEGHETRITRKDGQIWVEVIGVRG